MEITMENGNNLMEYTSLIKKLKTNLAPSKPSAADELFTIEGMERPSVNALGHPRTSNSTFDHPSDRKQLRIRGDEYAGMTGQRKQ